MSIELTILMPCLNEAETLANCIQKAKQFLIKGNIQGEILIADNGSHDGSQKIAEENGARVVDVPIRGYGAALLHGIHHAKGDYIVMGDADDSYNFLNLSDFISHLRQGSELVMGSRFKGTIEQGAMPFLNKYLGNPILSLIGRIFFKSKISDFHCGLRGFKKESIRNLNLQSTGMEFASEMIVKATLQKLKITEVPTTLSPDGRSRKPHLRPWRDGWRHLRLLLLLSPTWLFLYPGLILLFGGSVLMGLLIKGPFQFNNHYLDIHTLLFSSAFMIVGLQIIFFYIFIKFYEDNRFDNFIKKLTLEKGLMVGFLLVLLGAGGAIYGFNFWAQHSFGSLLPTHMMRIIIPALTFLMAGIQIVFASFFLGTLKLFQSSFLK
jgi:glycosyltransferase involved in cell wall biosynthesis